MTLNTQRALARSIDPNHSTNPPKINTHEINTQEINTRRSSHPYRMRPARTLYAGLVAALSAFLLLISGTAASAHDHLVDSEPAAQAQLDASPTELTLTFSGEVLEMGAEVSLSDANDQTWAVGEPVVDGHEFSVPVTDALPDGSYTLLWRVVSSDGHPISGDIPFTVVGAAAATTSESEATESATTTDSASEETDGEATGAATTEDAEATATQDDAASSETTTDQTESNDPTTEAATTDEDTDETNEGSGIPWLPIGIGVLVLIGAGVAFSASRRRND